MTTVGTGGGWSDSSPACVDDVVLDMGVAAGGVVEGNRVMTPGGCPRLRDTRAGVESNGGGAVPPPQPPNEGGAFAAAAWEGGGAAVGEDLLFTVG